MSREVVFGAERRRLGEAVRELLGQRDLLELLVRRDIRLVYRQTLLGVGWAVLRPLLGMLVLTVVFGRVAGLESDGVPYALFVLTALVPWTYFQSATQAASLSLVHGAHVITKVYFPRLGLPLAPVLAQLLDLAIGLALLGLFLAVSPIRPNAGVLFLPLLVLLAMATALGIGLWLSALAIQFRDVKHVLPLMLQLLLFVAPVVWPVSMLEATLGPAARWVLALFPMAGVIEGFRSAWLGTVPMPWDMIGIGAATAGALLVSGALFFLHRERHFADVA